MSTADLRGTGRTHRMIERARDAVLAGDPVLLVGCSQVAAMELARRLGVELAAVVSDYAQVRAVARVTWPGGLEQVRGFHARVFVDHAALELLCEGDVAELDMVSHPYITGVGGAR